MESTGSYQPARRQVTKQLKADCYKILCMGIKFFNSRRHKAPGIGYWVSGVSPAAGLKSLPALESGQSNRKRNFFGT